MQLRTVSPAQQQHQPQVGATVGLAEVSIFMRVLQREQQHMLMERDAKIEARMETQWQENAMLREQALLCEHQALRLEAKLAAAVESKVTAS